MYPLARLPFITRQSCRRQLEPEVPSRPLSPSGHRRHEYDPSWTYSVGLADEPGVSDLVCIGIEQSTRWELEDILATAWSEMRRSSTPPTGDPAPIVLPRWSEPAPTAPSVEAVAANVGARDPRVAPFSRQEREASGDAT